MLGNPFGFYRTSTPSIIGSSHSSNVGGTFSSTVDPSIPQSIGAQLVIGTRSLFSSQKSLLQPTPFPSTFSMWNTPHIGSSPLQQQPSPIQNQNANAQFTPGSLGMFHPGSGDSPPFPSGNLNTNLVLGSSVGFPFGWNWNNNTPHG